MFHVEHSGAKQPPDGDCRELDPDLRKASGRASRDAEDGSTRTFAKPQVRRPFQCRIADGHSGQCSRHNPAPFPGSIVPRETFATGSVHGALRAWLLVPPSRLLGAPGTVIRRRGRVFRRAPGHRYAAPHSRLTRRSGRRLRGAPDRGYAALPKPSFSQNGDRGWPRVRPATRDSSCAKIVSVPFQSRIATVSASTVYSVLNSTLVRTLNFEGLQERWA